MAKQTENRDNTSDWMDGIIKMPIQQPPHCTRCQRHEFGMIALHDSEGKIEYYCVLCLARLAFCHGWNSAQGIVECEITPNKLMEDEWAASALCKELSHEG